MKEAIFVCLVEAKTKKDRLVEKRRGANCLGWDLKLKWGLMGKRFVGVGTVGDEIQESALVLV